MSMNKDWQETVKKLQRVSQKCFRMVSEQQKNKQKGKKKRPSKNNRKNCNKNVIIFQKGVAICKRLCYNTNNLQRRKGVSIL